MGCEIRSVCLKKKKKKRELLLFFRLIVKLNSRSGYISTTRPLRRLDPDGSRSLKSVEEVDINRFYCCTRPRVVRLSILRMPRRPSLHFPMEMDLRHHRKTMFADRSLQVQKNRQLIILPGGQSLPILIVQHTFTHNVEFTVIIKISLIFKITSLPIR